MKQRSVASVILAFALLAPGVSGQGTTGSTARAREVEVLASAVTAISRMHMESFSDSVLWEAAIGGLIDALNDPYA